MNILILGGGDQERAWARWFRTRSPHRVVGLFPGFSDSSEDENAGDVPPAVDLDAALAIPGIDLVIVGGAPEFRMEALRRVAAIGAAAISLHPPGPDSEAYYQVSLSREETGAVIVPDAPWRLHPGVVEIIDAVGRKTFGGLVGVRLDAPIAEADDRDLAREVFPTAVDAVRAIAGEVEAVWAIGRPHGLAPRTALTVYLDMAGGVRSEINVRRADSTVHTLTVQFERGMMELQRDPRPGRFDRLDARPTVGGEQVVEFDHWDSHEAIFSILLRSIENRTVASQPLPRPNLDDGIRAMEIAEGVVRSLRRERKVDLHYQSIAEEANFKSVMTSTGCLILLSVLLILPLALAGPSLGFPGLIYISYLIPVVLCGFIVLQALRFAVRKPDLGGGGRSRVAVSEATDGRDESDDAP